MPNTLAHLGVGVVATRAAGRRLDLRWALLGCVVPDVPWILARAVRALAPGVDGWDLRVYAVVQSSFAVCLVLCAALAVLSRAPRITFGVLAGNALLHLLLDACQTKWGNGVHLFAPVRWDLWNFGLFWPESVPTYALTALGAVAAGWLLVQRRRGALATTGLAFSPPRRLVLAIALGGLYLVAPLALLGGAEAADAHFVHSLRERGSNPGAPVALDRAGFEGGRGGGNLTLFSGERVAVRGNLPAAPGRVSLRGHLAADGAIEVDAFHEHRGFSRDLASYVGLAAVAAAWLIPPRSRRP